jgi:hypothetical protein
MAPLEIIGTAASLCRVIGWPLCAAVLAAGMVLRLGGFGLPGELAGQRT